MTLKHADNCQAGIYSGMHPCSCDYQLRADLARVTAELEESRASNTWLRNEVARVTAERDALDSLLRRAVTERDEAIARAKEAEERTEALRTDYLQMRDAWDVATTQRDAAEALLLKVDDYEVGDDELCDEIRLWRCGRGL